MYEDLSLEGKLRLALAVNQGLIEKVSRRESVIEQLTTELDLLERENTELRKKVESYEHLDLVRTGVAGTPVPINENKREG